MRPRLLPLFAALAAASPAAAFPPPSHPDVFWNREVADAPLDPHSDAVIDRIAAAGGFGLGRMQIDFSIEVLEAGPGTPWRHFAPTGDHFSPDCDLGAVPLPPGGALEGEDGYRCTGDGDCHLVVFEPAHARLFEMWRADLVDGELRGGCLAVWDLARPYGPSGRGEQCTSADAAGLPIAPLLFDADEVAAGEIGHAVRFVLPNDRIRHRTYVRPATHATGAASGGPDAPPYGTRLRLRADYPVESLAGAGARVVARALQRYGMVLADGGSVALTARSDRFTAAKWDGLLGPHDLRPLGIRDFEMVAAGGRFAWTGDCTRTPQPPFRPRVLPVRP